MVYAASGATILPFVPRGTDTVPAMLTPGEGVVSRAGMQSLGSAGLSALNRGDSLGSPTTAPITINHTWTISAIDSRDLRTKVEKEILPMIITEIEDFRRGSTVRLANALKRVG